MKKKHITQLHFHISEPVFFHFYFYQSFSHRCLYFYLRKDCCVLLPPLLRTGSLCFCCCVFQMVTMFHLVTPAYLSPSATHDDLNRPLGSVGITTNRANQLLHKVFIFFVWRIDLKYNVTMKSQRQMKPQYSPILKVVFHHSTADYDIM